MMRRDPQTIIGYRHVGAGSDHRVIGVNTECGTTSGELPITLTRSDRTVIQQQKIPVSIFGLTFYRPVLERFYRQGGPYPPVYSIFLFTNDGTDVCRVV
jgi:hypothetical protein